MVVTEMPWTLTRGFRAHCHDGGLSDDDILHAITLSAYFGHLNRIADATGVPLDYNVRLTPPALEAAVPAFSRAPSAVTGSPAIPLEQRGATATAITAWHRYVFEDSTGPLAREHRMLIAWRVAVLVGEHADDATTVAFPLDRALIDLTDRITLAPWQIDASSYAPLRALGFDDRALFDACVAASTANVVSRISVALAALGR
jgi:hypothetical protein